MRVEVRVAGAPPTETTAVSQRIGYRVEWRLSQVVDNPQHVRAFSASPKRPSRKLTLSDSLVDPAKPCDYVIVTSRALHSAFEPLAGWRRTQGLAVGVFDIEDILEVYQGRCPSGGSDDATRLRDFLVDAYTTWASSEHPLQYVLLGGDTEIIPVRSMFVRAGIYETSAASPLVSDVYYAGLDGTWDDDADGRYGEGAVEGGGTGEAGEEADLLAELFVGRVPVNERSTPPTDQEARNWLAKVLAYESDPQADFLSRAVWLGEHLDAKTDGGDSKDLILEIAPGLNITRLYDSIAHWSASDLSRELDDGAHLVNHLGHASVSRVIRMSAFDVSNLSNEQPFLVHSQGCLAAAISTRHGEAIAERFITDEHGAFAFIGNTSYGWYMPGGTNGASQACDLEFFDALYQEDIRHLGWALQDAKEDLLGGIGAVGPERWVYLELLLLGDPYTPIITAYADPVAHISDPTRQDKLAGLVPIRGSAHAGRAAGASFNEYSLTVGAGSSPVSWSLIQTETVPVSTGVLGQWDTGALMDGSYTLHLEATDGRGLIAIEELVVEVDHACLSSPAPDSYVRAGESIAVRGTASRGDLIGYAVDYGSGSIPLSWARVISSTTPVVSGTLALWDTSHVDEAGEYTLRLTLMGTDYSGEDRVSLTLDPGYHSGWPRMVNSRLSNESLAVGDLDGDGALEVVATEGMRVCGGALEGGRCGAYGMLIYVWDAKGELLHGWPRMPGSDNYLTAPALADLDDDGTLEIVVGSIDGSVYAYHYDGSAVAGWPQRTAGEIHDAPSCADLDGDGMTEVVVCNALGHVYAWHGGGAPVSGWPQDAGSSANSPLLADLDGDGNAEVIVVSESGRASVWRSDGTAYPGWPIQEPTRFLASPVAGDLDRDGRLEIVAPSESAAYVWRSDGSPMRGWPKTNVTGNVGSSPALADLDGDGYLEIISVDATGSIQAWNHDGTHAARWGGNAAGAPLSSIIVGDIDGDDRLEIIVGSDDGDEYLYAYNHDGTPLLGWPRRIPQRDTPPPQWDRRTTGTLTDLDGDGDLELGIGVEGYVYFWDVAGDASVTVPWPTFQGDMARTGALPGGPPVPLHRQVFPLLF